MAWAIATPQIATGKLPSFGEFLSTTINVNSLGWQNPKSSCPSNHNETPTRLLISSLVRGAQTSRRYASSPSTDKSSPLSHDSLQGLAMSESTQGLSLFDDSASFSRPENSTIRLATDVSETIQNTPKECSHPPTKPRKDKDLPLNPHYTRDGNPRERLARACDRCRTQKIRCRLEDETCLRCARLGMMCRFDSGRMRHRRVYHGRPPPSTDFSSRELLVDIPRARTAVNPKHMSIEIMLSPPMEEPPRGHAPLNHNHHLAEQIFSAIERPPLPMECTYELSGHGKLRDELIQTGERFICEDLSVEVDPTTFDIDLSLHYAELFFDYVNTTTFYLLPQHAFVDWLKRCGNKSASENMVVYTVMAAGATFSKRPDAALHHEQSLRIAEKALDGHCSKSTMEVVHTYLVLGIIHTYRGCDDRASAYSLAASRTAYGIKFNYDGEFSNPQSCPGYIAPEHMVECQERTFWLSHTRQCLQSSCHLSGNAASQLTGSFQLPYRDGYNSSSTQPRMKQHHGPTVSPSPTALYVQVSLILQDAVTWIHSSRNLGENEYRSQLSETILALEDRLRSWNTRVTSVELHLDVRSFNLQLIFHTIHIILYRYVRHSFLDNNEVSHHIKRTQHWAWRLLREVARWHSRGGTGASIDPVAASSILLALDTFTATGMLAKISDRLDESSQNSILETATTGVIILSELAEVSRLTRMQLDKTEPRLAALFLHRGVAIGSRKQVWRFEAPLYEMFERNIDVLYGLSKATLLKALSVQSNCIMEEESLLIMDAERSWER